MNNSLKKIREYGQEMTPRWVAKIMLSYFTNDVIEQILDPAVGNGVFYLTLKELKPSEKFKFFGYDIDNEIINEGYLNNTFDQFCAIRNEDFIMNFPKKEFNHIVSNPPYIRHHRISTENKKIFKEICLRNIGKAIDGRAGIHIYFLIISLNMLSKGGKLSIILPSDSCEGVFSKDLWKWVTSQFCIEKVITFNHKTSPFPKRDNNPMIFFITRNNQKKSFEWIKVRNNNNDSAYNDIIASNVKSDNIEIIKRDIGEALCTGLSRAPNYRKEDYKLCDFASVMRGIATGDNNFFFLKSETAQSLEIPSHFLVKAVGRSRDVVSDIVSENDIRMLDEKGRPTMLLNLDNAFDSLPHSLQKYIGYGEKIGINKKALISTRNPWYKMEKRKPPDFLFAYLGRRNVRFIFNKARVVPLTGFLCVYSFNSEEGYLKKFWKVLNDPVTLNNLCLVGKTYGSGAIKVEPKALLELPINKNVLEKYELSPPAKNFLF